MTIFVYVSDLAKNDCMKHGMGTECLDSVKERIEGPQSIEGFERSNPHPVLIKKKFYGRDKRLVAVQKHVEQDTVIVLLRVLIRGNNEYENNFEGRVAPETTVAYVESAFQEVVTEQALAEFVRQRNAVDPPIPLPEVSSSEWGFLTASAFPEADDDTIVCETHEFVEDLQSQAVLAQHIRIPNLIIDVLNISPGKVEIVSSREDPGLQLLAYNSSDTRQCVLLRAFFRADQAAREAGSIWSDKLSGADSTTILRFCRVSYPILICGDESAWLHLHTDTIDGSDGVANLSLSPEEGGILTSCERFEGENCGFPLFINGRAGSGKSTLLQYLFSFAFRRWLNTLGQRGDASTRPLYLASSGNLLRVAETAAHSILSVSSSQILEGDLLTDRQSELLSDCFQPTSSFLHSLVPPDDHTKFPIENRIDYAGFRRLWNSQFRNDPKAIQDYGPQVSWHVIRGLIKGFSSAELLEIQDYEGLPRDERTIAKETFERVYSKVWFSWYRTKCDEDGLWDDQDLVHYLLENNHLPRQHVAIFCDEAQDFTRVELDALYQCSLFSKRSLDAPSVPRIPFVFAGDPFQTLNPTGFRWESVQAAFTERLVASLHRFNHFSKLPDLHYEELTFNYRSAKRIVHFCNALQASRAILFKHSSLRPQETWRIQDERSAPTFLDVSNVQVTQALKEQKDLVLIVPCEEGEEAEYVAGNALLRDIVDLGDDDVPLNVVSAARSKGLEYRRVGLFGWSERPEAERIASLLRDPESAKVGQDEKLKLEYFMNNLYVAASRAQRRLFVIDKEESRNSLWWIVDDEEHIDLLRKSLSPEWAENIGCMVTGTAESFQHDQDTNKRRAEQQKAEGLAKQSSYTLVQAARYYELDGNEVEANRCRGYAHRYKQGYERSAVHFEQAGDVHDAIESLWQGELFSNVASLAERHPTEASLPECALSLEVSSGEGDPTECAELLNRLLSTFETNSKYKRRLTEPGWNSSISQIITTLLQADILLNGAAADAVVDPLLKLMDLGLNVPVGALAQLHLKAENYDRVLELLTANPNSDLYRDAFALRGLERSAQGFTVSMEEASNIGDYLLRSDPQQLVAAAKYFIDAGNPSQVRYCFEQGCIDNGLSESDLEKLVTLVLAFWTQNQNWSDLVSALEFGRLTISPSKDGRKRAISRQKNGQVLSIIRKNQLQFRLVVPELATSSRFAEYMSHEKHAVQRYLRQLAGTRDWVGAVTPKLMGAAIERAGRDIDALEFYEKIQSLPDHTYEEKQHAKVRWVVCKFRQAERQGSRRNENAALDAMVRFGLSGQDVTDEFPTITESDLRPGQSNEDKVLEIASRTEVLPDGKRVAVGSLEMNFLVKRGWVNVDSKDGLRARVVLSARCVESDDTEVVVLGDEYDCPEIGLHVSWSQAGDAILQHSDHICVARKTEAT